MAAHTPAPWTFQRADFEHGYCYRLEGSRGEPLGDSYGAHREGEEAQYRANARLIAKSPEMFDALEEAEQVFRVLALEGPSATALELADRYAALLAAIRGTD